MKRGTLLLVACLLAGLLLASCAPAASPAPAPAPAVALRHLSELEGKVREA